jgi:two-component system, OmpR family, response regulator MtrA
VAHPWRVDGSLKVLVVDDEPAMVGVIGALLGQAGHRIVAAYDGPEALRRFRDEEPDLVLLDLAMPHGDGAQICREIRAESDTPIIIVTGEDASSATVELLDAGADDYLRKPFRGDELLARARAVVRRRQRPTGRGGWVVDRRRDHITFEGRELGLTRIESRLVTRLLERPDQIVTPAELFAAAWPGVGDPDARWLKPHIARLRAKLVRAGAPAPAATRGVGYRIPTSVTEPVTVA